MKAFTFLVSTIMAAASVLGAAANDTRCIMYLTGQHVVMPESKELRDGISHVILAFLTSDKFAVEEPPEDYELFITIDEVRSHFPRDTKVTVAIGGWGDWKGFDKGARTPESRKNWAEQVKIMVDRLGADGVDIDWEYPGGNRDDYKEIPNSERVWEIEAFVALLQQLRETLGPDKLLTIATPGQEGDLLAFTHSTMPRIVKEVDFINVMTYDLMTRRHNVTTHHSGVEQSSQAVQRYIDRGAPAHQLNLGLGYYTKFFNTTCHCDAQSPLGCRTVLMEDPDTGADLGQTGGFSWHDEVPLAVAESFARARSEGVYFEDGSYGYWDHRELKWWTFDTPRVVKRKMDDVVHGMALGGVFAWGLGEDAPEFAHLTATVRGLRNGKTEL